MNLLIKLIATGFGAGYSPVAPGTVGSLWGVLIFYFLRNQNLYISTAVVIGLFLIGVWASTQAEKVFGKKDAQSIVIDEVAGQYLTLFLPLCFFTTTHTLLYLGAGFVLFRFFDIIKIFPARWAQDHFPKGWGVMMDDIVAGFQAAAVLMFITAIT